MTPPVTATTPRDSVRRRTRALHDRLEALPLAQAIVAERVEPAHYAALLEHLQPLHRALEAGLAAHPQLASLAAEAERSASLERDLALLPPSPIERHEVAQQVAAQIELLCQEPSGALAAAYVVVGSRMGGRVLVRHLARCLDVPQELGVGLDYHLEGHEGFPQRWRQICASLGEHVAPHERESFALAGEVAMQCFYDLYQALGRELGL